MVRPARRPSGDASSDRTGSAMEHGLRERRHRGGKAVSSFHAHRRLQSEGDRHTGRYGLLGRLRDECLNCNWFTDIEHATEVVEVWKQDYNEVRPHGSLGGLTPKEYERANSTRGLTQKVA